MTGVGGAAIRQSRQLRGRIERGPRRLIGSRFGQVENDEPVSNDVRSRGGDDLFFTGMHDDR